MTNGDQDDARRQDQANRERYAIRRAERAMAAEERTMENGLDGLEDDIEDAEATIDADLRDEHLGHDPEQPPFWSRPG